MSILGFVSFRWSLFVVESLVATFPFFLFGSKRRKYFPLRLVLFLGILAASLCGISFLLDYAIDNFGSDNPGTTVLTCSTYIYFLSLFVGMIAFLFEGRIYGLFSSFVKGYALRQITFCLYILFVILINPNLNFLEYEHVNWQAGLLYAFFYVIVYAFFFLLIAKGLVPIYRTDVGTQTLAFYIVVLLANIIINAICESYSRGYRLMYILVMFSQLLSLVLLVAFDILVRRSQELKVQKYISDQMLKQQEMQYRFAKTNMEQLKIRAHDLRHQVRILRKGGEEAEALLESLEDEIGAYDAIIVTDNQVLNIILQEKWYYCQKHGIKLTTIVNPNAFQKVSNTDLYTMIGNILDNAIEAVLRIKDKEKRILSVEVAYKNTLSSFRCDNYFEGDLAFKGKGLMTTKEDKVNHGFGLRSIETIAKKYGGQMKISAEDNIFTLLVTIPDAEGS